MEEATAFDTEVTVETPEGVQLVLHPAGVPARGLAWLIDFGIRLVAYIVILQLSALFGVAGQGIALILVFLLEWGYPVVFELLPAGATPGKRAMGLYVVREDGAPLGWSRSVARNLLRALDFLPVGYGLGLVAMLSSRHFRRLGDQVAGTLVVYREMGHRGGRVPTAAPRPPALSLDPTEQAAVVRYAERLQRLSPRRRDELAGLLEPVLGAEATADTLVANANWLVGRR